ncbi:MAG: hypothetical protein IT271_00065 [Chitinophagales bacterium]|nr:hypothetical protein [Chitinophagales bacterium]
MKSVQNLIIILFVGFTALLQGCKKEIRQSDNTINPIVKEENTRLDAVVPTTTITTCIQGKILDEEGNPLADVQLSANGKITTTDAKGFFTFGEMEINGQYAVIIANKAGYFTGVRTFSPTANAFNTVEIQLMKKNASQSFTSSSSTSLEFESGKVKLEFPANAIATESGAAYKGTVKVYARYIDPSTTNFTGIMPGMLAGLTNENQITAMISYGMVNVELEDGSGNKLEVAANTKVKVTLPAKPTAPATIPVWHFNEAHGLWVEAGTAAKTGVGYTFEANCFSPWNCDQIINTANVTIIIQGQNGKSVGNQQIDVYTSDFLNKIGTVFTDGSGKIILTRVPQNVGLRLVNDCGLNIQKSLNITAPTAIITVNSAEINSGRIYTITGKIIDCGDTIYADRYYSITGVDNPEIYFGGRTDSAGNYSLTSILCSTVNTTTPYRVRAVLHISNTTIKTDTFSITFSGSSQANKYIEFCSLNFISNQFNPGLTYGTMTDIDGNVYKTIKIGTQTWMAENLKTTHLNDGTLIPHLTNRQRWDTLTTAAYIYFNYDTRNIAKYGNGYNWFAIGTGKLAPAGWHVPTNTEVNTLVNYLGGNYIAGNKMKSSGFWTPFAGITNTNSSGFSALGTAGYINVNGFSGESGTRTAFWTATTSSGYTTLADCYFLYNDYSSVGQPGFIKTSGFYVRCIKN